MVALPVGSSQERSISLELTTTARNPAGAANGLPELASEKVAVTVSAPATVTLHRSSNRSQPVTSR